MRISRAQNSLLAPETPTCLCGSQVPCLRGYLRGCSDRSAVFLLPASVPRATELVNMATRVTCSHYLASS